MDSCDSLPTFEKKPDDLLSTQLACELEYDDHSSKETRESAEPLPRRQRQLVGGFWVPLTCSTEKLKLAVQHAHPRDDAIVFDDGGDGSLHDYYIQGEKNTFISCTTFIHSFFPEFDAPKVAAGMVAKKDKFLKGPYRHLVENRTKDEDIVQALVDAWRKNGDEQSALGTKMHRNIELFYNDLTPEDSSSVEFGHFLKFHSQTVHKNWQALRTEIIVWDEESRICGSVDMLYVDTSLGQSIEAWQRGEIKLRIHLVDWKRSKCISRFAFGDTRNQKFGKPPCDNQPNANYFHYKLQVNLYKYILEKRYNVIVDSMAIVVCHPNQSSFQCIEMPDEQTVIQKMVQTRMEQPK